MKKSEIEKVDGGYQVILHLEEKTSEGYPLIQRFIEKGLKEVFESLREFYGEDNGRKGEGKNENK